MLCLFNIFASVAILCGLLTMSSLVLPVIMSKKVEVNSPFLCQYMQLKITYPRSTVRSFYPSPHLLVLFSEVVLSLFLTYIYHILTDILIYHIVYSHHFLIECIHLFLSSDSPKELEGNIFYNGRVADW